MVGNGDAQIIFDGSPLSFLHFFFVYLIVTLCIISSSSWSIHIFIKKGTERFFLIAISFQGRTHTMCKLSLSCRRRRRRCCAAHILLFLIFFSMLSCGVQRHLQESIIFCTTFFSRSQLIFCNEYKRAKMTFQLEFFFYTLINAQMWRVYYSESGSWR